MEVDENRSRHLSYNGRARSYVKNKMDKLQRRKYCYAITMSPLICNKKKVLLRPVTAKCLNKTAMLQLNKASLCYIKMSLLQQNKCCYAQSQYPTAKQQAMICYANCPCY